MRKHNNNKYIIFIKHYDHLSEAVKKTNQKYN